MFQLDFDPTKLSYRDLVREIWANRRGGRSYSRQYMEAVFAETGEQEQVARELGVTVPIVTGATFYRAEDYHQKYHLRRDKLLMAELAAYSPRELTDSTVAARLNGYVTGRGLLAQLRDELPQLGLSPAASTYLERLVAQRD